MDPTPEDQNWVICPFCHRPNRPGRRICSYCWSPKLGSATPVSTAEMQAIVNRYESMAKRRYTVKFTAITLICLLLAAALTWLVLTSFTDVLNRPAPSFNSSSPAGQWTMFRHDLLCSGTADETDTGIQGEVLWTFPAGDAIQSSPVVSGGIVYFGSRDSKFYAVDAATGTGVWEFQAGSWVDSSPVVAGGTVYFGSNDGYFYALDAATGQLIWSFETPYPIKSQPAMADGIVFFGGGDSILYALDAATGKKLWQYEADGRIETAPVVNNGIVYFTASSSLYALNARSGHQRLDFQAYNPVSSSPAVSGTTVYFGNASGILYAVDGNARNWLGEHTLKPYWMNFYLWGIAPEPKPQSGSIWGIKLGKVISSGPAAANGMLYVGVDNSITAIDTNTQETVWSLETGDQIKSSPTVAGNTVYAGSNDGLFYAVEAGSGQLLWSVPTGGPVASSAAIAGGTLYFTSHDGTLYAVR